MVLATSAKDEELDLMLDALGARDAVDTVVSSGDVRQAKPDPEIVFRALEESGTDPGGAVMVGDTVWDVLAAQRAGLPCVGLLSGGIAEEELRGAARTAASGPGSISWPTTTRRGRPRARASAIASSTGRAKAGSGIWPGISSPDSRRSRPTTGREGSTAVGIAS